MWRKIKNFWSESSRKERIKKWTSLILGIILFFVVQVYLFNIPEYRNLLIYPEEEINSTLAEANRIFALEDPIKQLAEGTATKYRYHMHISMDSNSDTKEMVLTLYGNQPRTSLNTKVEYSYGYDGEFVLNQNSIKTRTKHAIDIFSFMIVLPLLIVGAIYCLLMLILKIVRRIVRFVVEIFKKRKRK